MNAQPESTIAAARPDQDDTVVARWNVSILVTSHSPEERATYVRGIHERSGGRGPFVTIRYQTRDRSGNTVSAPLAAAGDPAELRRPFEEARGGTLFLDGISNMDASEQRQLFFLLGERAWAAMPASRHVRIIAAADPGLLAAVAARTFDEALFYRLNVIHIDLTEPVRWGTRSPSRAEEIVPHAQTADV